VGHAAERLWRPYRRARSPGNTRCLRARRRAERREQSTGSAPGVFASLQGLGDVVDDLSSAGIDQIPVGRCDPTAR
jgi:hypothetical protein